MSKSEDMKKQKRCNTFLNSLKLDTKLIKGKFSVIKIKIIRIKLQLVAKRNIENN